MSGTLLATKTHIPPLRSNLIHRPHLVQWLNNGISQNHHLILVSAPAGNGKSTLLSEWISQLDIPVAWLSLEKGENIPILFWNYFITALSTIPQVRQLGIGEEFLQALQSSQPLTMDLLLIDLVNELSKLEVGVILVLDDLHTITEGQIHHDLVFLIEHMLQSSKGFCLVVVGLREIVATTYVSNNQDEAKGILRCYGVGGSLRMIVRMLFLYAKSPAFRKLTQGVRQGGIAPENLEEYISYGLFVG